MMTLIVLSKRNLRSLSVDSAGGEGGEDLTKRALRQKKSKVGTEEDRKPPFVPGSQLDQ